jgi:hypothetical protein
MQKYFCLAEGISEEMANIVFNKTMHKVIKDAIKHARLVSIALYYSQVLKQLIKPSKAHNTYLTKEQQLQGKVNWLVKDPEVWDTMCEWCASVELRALSEQNQHNRWSKVSVHRYGADGHVRKTHRLV